MKMHLQAIQLLPKLVTALFQVIYGCLALASRLQLVKLQLICIIHLMPSPKRALQT